MLYRTVFLAAVMFFFCKAGAGEVFSIQFATRSDFISLGTLFVLPEDNGPALRLVLKNDSVVPAPAPGTGVLCYESVYAPVQVPDAIRLSGFVFLPPYLLPAGHRDACLSLRCARRGLPMFLYSMCFSEGRLSA